MYLHYYFFICTLLFCLYKLKLNKKKKKNNNKITIVSWNTNGVIQNSASFPTRFHRGLQHPFFTDDTIDVLCLQEIFRGPVKLLAMEELKKHGYTQIYNDTEILPIKKVIELSGLVCAFKTGNNRDNGLTVFKERTSFDILAQKGFYHTVTDSGVHILNLHLQSILREHHVYDTYCFSRISVYQRKQLKQLFSYIQKNLTSRDKIIILGDFNINPYFDYINGVYLSVNMSRLGFTMRGYDSFNYKNNKTYDCRFLDHVWYKNLKIQNQPAATSELLLFSDHLPVKTTFVF